jgi:hypothetical protein
MKNITVSVDDETYRNARIHAAQTNTTVSAMVREFLVGLAGGTGLDPKSAEFRRLAKEDVELRNRTSGYSYSGRMTRDESHDRSR